MKSKTLLRLAAPALVVAAGLLITNQIADRLRGDESSKSSRSSENRGGDAGLSDSAQNGGGTQGSQDLSSSEVKDPLPPDVVQMGYETDAPNDIYPIGCPLVRGTPCVVTFRGNYRLATRDEGILRFGGFADGGRDPVCHTDLQVPRGTARLWKQMTCPVPASAKKMLFKAILVDLDGNLLYDPVHAAPELQVR